MGAIIEIIQNIKRLCQEKGAIIEEQKSEISQYNLRKWGQCWRLLEVEADVAVASLKNIFSL